MTLPEFFQLLYHSHRPDEWLAITTIGQQRVNVSFFDRFDGVLYQYISAMNETFNVYYGVGLLDAKLPYGQRGSKDHICALPGLWADIDIDIAANHKKKKLFKSEIEALEVIKGMGLLPSITVRTGGGLHLYWLFNTLWRLTNFEEQMRADRISQGFQTAILREAKLKNAEIDMTGDITRILRCPDTVNKKNRVPCEVIEDSGARYEPDQFLQFEDDYPIKLHSPKHGKPAVIISSKEKPDFTLLNVVMTADPTLAGKLNRNDIERFGGDDSAVDMSVASSMAHMGLAPELLAMGVLYTRGRVDNKAASRPDYVARTVARAFVGTQTKDDEAAEKLRTAHHMPIDLTENERQGVLRELSTRLDTKIKNVIEYTGTRHTYEVVTEHGKFDLGDCTTVVKWSTFNSAIVQLEKRQIPSMKAEQWNTTVNMVLLAAETKDTGGSGDEEVWLRNYLFEYCLASREYPHEGGMDYPKMDADPKLWVKDNSRFIHAMSFKAWMKHEMRGEDRLVNSRFAAKMTGLGCKPVRLACKLRGNRSSFDAWLIPKDIWSPALEVQDHEPGSEQTNGHLDHVRRTNQGEPGKSEDLPPEKESEAAPREKADDSDDLPF